MIDWQKQLLFSPDSVAPLSPDRRVLGVFNPGALRRDDHVELLVRIAEQPIDYEASVVGSDSDQPVPLPRIDGDRWVVDHVPAKLVEPIDARVVRDHRPLQPSGFGGGRARLTSISHLRHAVVPVGQITDPSAYRWTGRDFHPAGENESMGVEDARITRIDGRTLFTYVSVSPHGACPCLAEITKSGIDRWGAMFPCENKDVVLFPEKIGGQFMVFHRPVSATPFGTPEIWTARSDDLRHWGEHRILRVAPDADPNSWRSGRIGASTVPIRTDAGWVHLYHANRRPRAAGEVGSYYGALMRCDLERPQWVNAASPGPVLEPSESWETSGFVPGVVFPTAWIELDRRPDLGDRVAILYGAADERTAVAIGDREALLATLQPTASTPRSIT